MPECVLKIIDQVNVKFEGLEPHVRKNLVDKLKYYVPYARHMPSFKLGRWDGKVAFATVGGGTYLNLLDKALPIVMGAGYEIEIDDRRPAFSVTFPEIREDMFAETPWPDGHPMQGQPILLRDYQVEAIRRYTENLQSIQSISTGAGKTLLTASLSKLCEPFGRTIVIVPSKQLVAQTEEDYVNLGLDVGVFFGDRKEWGKTHTICTWQSLSIFSKKSRQGEVEVPVDGFLDGVVCVMVDECFAAHTPVLTPVGWKRIDEIRAGDTVINFSPERREFKEDTVVRVFENMLHSESEEMLELVMDTGAVIHVTANHKFLTDRGWVRADELTDSDVIVSYNEEIVRSGT